MTVTNVQEVSGQIFKLFFLAGPGSDDDKKIAEEIRLSKLLNTVLIKTWSDGLFVAAA